MRDEAHRFSRRLHHKAEKSRVFGDWLDSVKGIGPQKRKEILANLEMTPMELGQKSVEEVAKLLGVKESIAERVLARIRELA